ncbi:MAG: glycoside hydrolase family 3 N-terminal domain-containing protein [bacterium]|nr:glycoside hydrolase family 3 N-terminal domain-containing protein [bacterium]
MKLRKYIGISLSLLLAVTACGCSDTKKVTVEITPTPMVTADPNATKAPIAGPTKRPEAVFTKTKDVKSLVKTMTVEEKASQMVQGSIEYMTPDEMLKYGYGGVFGVAFSLKTTEGGWKELIKTFQTSVKQSDSGIPAMYGIESEHGVGYLDKSVVFPQNINIGIANDNGLTKKMGKQVGEELKLTGVRWTLSPNLVNVKDPRWGATYESYSSDLDRVKSLAASYVEGLAEAKVMSCAKYFITGYSGTYMTKENKAKKKTDDVAMSEAEIYNALYAYREIIDAGCETIMLGSGSVNGVKMHENKDLITNTLKGDTMEYKGIVVSDYDGIHTLDGELKQQVIKAVNAGVDVLMETKDYELCRKYIIEGVKEGSISMDRINDATQRILKVKKDMGLLDDPDNSKLKSSVKKAGTSKVRETAEELVEKSCVLIKNKKSVLPFHTSDSLKIFVTGPAANDIGVQCGGYTMTKQGKTDASLTTSGKGKKQVIDGGTTILAALKEIAKSSNLTIITDEKKAKNADITLLCLGEKPYALDSGNTDNISITGPCGLDGNKEAIKQAKKLGHTTVTLIVAGRNVRIDDYISDWDAVVMCGLPGTEGSGIANILTEKAVFSGKLAMPWYKDEKDILVKDKDNNETVLYGFDYGRQY